MIYNNFDNLRVGDSFKRSFTITRKLVNDFATITGDNNPIHIDDEYASKSIFKKPIAHGFLIGSIFSKILGCHFPGNGTIYLKQTMKFIHPVYFNDEITGEVIVFAKNEEKKTVQLTTIAYNQENKIVIDGEALIIPPR